MRVLVLAQRFPPDTSGSCTRAWNVVKGLEELGHELVVVAAFFLVRIFTAIVMEIAGTDTSKRLGCPRKGLF